VTKESMSSLDTANYLPPVTDKKNKSKTSFGHYLKKTTDSDFKTIANRTLIKKASGVSLVYNKQFEP
jgi:hypothetical protein